MIFSKQNIFSKIADSDEYFIVNLLSGHADILDKEKADEIIGKRYTDTEEYISKGYLVDETAETSLFRKRYADFIDARETDEIQIFFVPWYSCNFGCSYCYQEGYSNQLQFPDEETVNAFFRYVAKEFAGRKKYLTLFGGEPLLPGENYHSFVASFLEKAKTAGLETAIVTNGYNLEEYIEILSSFSIREIQVTLDGVGTSHDIRRPLKGGGSTFDKIVRGIDLTLQKNIPVNLRVVLDKDNINELPAIAQFAIGRGWADNPNFKTQLGRNYELHYCQSEQSKLFARAEMYREIYRILPVHPEILQFHKPAFSISKFLFENGRLPDPLFDSCPGTKTEWAFDYTGSIYSCTATVGKQSEKLGTYYPSVSKNNALIERWEERDVTTIKECTTCSVQLACGGGCASVAYNASGNLHSPDCRPVKELLGMGISTYFGKECSKC